MYVIAKQMISVFDESYAVKLQVKQIFCFPGNSHMSLIRCFYTIFISIQKNKWAIFALVHMIFKNDSKWNSENFRLFSTKLRNWICWEYEKIIFFYCHAINQDYILLDNLCTGMLLKQEKKIPWLFPDHFKKNFCFTP